MSPHHRGLNPALAIKGETIGAASIIIAAGSRNIPKIKINSNATASIAHEPPGRLMAILLMRTLPPIPENIEPNAEAPMMIQQTIAVISNVSTDASKTSALVSFLFKATSRTAPPAPKEAASVGVAIPVNIDPSTIIISMLGRNTLRRASTFSLVVARSFKGRDGHRLLLK